MEVFKIKKCELKKLNLNNSESLKKIKIIDSEIENFNIDKCLLLNEAYILNSNFKILDFTKNLNLISLDIIFEFSKMYNYIIKLPKSTSKYLESLLNNFKIDNNFKNNIILENLELQNNLKYLYYNIEKIYKFPSNIIKLTIISKTIKYMNLSNLKKLQKLYVEDNSLETIDLPNHKFNIENMRSNKFLKRKIIKRKRIYRLCETQKEKNKIQKEKNEKKNENNYKNETCHRCQKYINKYLKNNIRQYVLIDNNSLFIFSVYTCC